MKKKTAAAAEALTLEQRNFRLRGWLKKHDALNLAKICRRIQYDRGALQHFIDSDLSNLGEDVLDRLEPALYLYDGEQELRRK